MIRDDYAAPETIEEARRPLHGFALGLLLGVSFWAAVGVAVVWLVGRGL